nr:RnfH family protein [Collimonas fungivorans]
MAAMTETVAGEMLLIQIQVCYASPGVQALKQLSVPAGTLLHDGIKRSGLLEEIREIDLSCWRVGIYGKLKTLDTVLRDQDRVEIYRPLIADPMESRRKRADKKAR